MSDPSDCQVHDSPHASVGRCAEAVRAMRATPAGEAPDVDQCSWLPDRWPEPHAGVRGIARDDDDLLDLSERAVARRRMMIVAARAFIDAIRVGNPAPVVQRLNDRFGARYDSDDDRGFRRGDLVVELTALRSDDTERIRTGFGILLTDRDEWWDTSAQWEAAIEVERIAHEEAGHKEPFDAVASCGHRMVDHAWYVQYGPKPEDVCRWTDCTFIALPTTADQIDELRRPVAAATNSGGVTVTRDDLIGTLADSGIQLRW